MSPIGSPSDSSRRNGETRLEDEGIRDSIEALNNVLLSPHRDPSQPASSSSESGSLSSTTRRKKRRAPLPPGRVEYVSLYTSSSTRTDFTVTDSITLH